MILNRGTGAAIKHFSGSAVLFLTCISIQLFAAQTWAAETDFKKPLFEYEVAIQEIQELRTPEVLALERFMAIHYDLFLGRPWKPDSFQAEFTARFDKFKIHFCPEVTEVCQVDGSVIGTFDSAARATARALLRAAAIAQINAKLELLKSHVRLTLPIHTPGLENAGNSFKAFNFILGEVADHPGEPFSRVKHLILPDVTSYYNGYQLADSPNYIALDDNGRVYVVEETLIAGALNLAAMMLTAQKAKDDFSASETPRFLLRRYLIGKNTDLVEYQKNLSLKQGLEWIAFRGLEKILLIQVPLLKVAAKPYTVRTILDIYLQTQQTAEPDLFMFLMLNHSIYESSPLVGQLATKSILNVILRENLVLLLAEEPYVQKSRFEFWSRNFNLPQLINREQFKAFLPELDLYLESKGLYDLSQWAKLTSDERRQIFEFMLFPKSIEAMKLNTEVVSIVGFYNLLGAMIRANDATIINEMSAVLVAERIK